MTNEAYERREWNRSAAHLPSQRIQSAGLTEYNSRTFPNKYVALLFYDEHGREYVLKKKERSTSRTSSHSRTFHFKLPRGMHSSDLPTLAQTTFFFLTRTKRRKTKKVRPGQTNRARAHSTTTKWKVRDKVASGRLSYVMILPRKRVGICTVVGWNWIGLGHSLPDPTTIQTTQAIT